MTDPHEHHPEHPNDRARQRRRQWISDRFTDIDSDASGRFQVRRSVHCRRCSYDLRSLDVDGRCPECGLEVWPSVIHMVDPTASKLPQLRDPRGVGNALVWLFACALLASICLALSGAMLMPDVLPPSGVSVGLIRLPFDLTLLSGGLAIAGLWSVWKFMPPRDSLPDVAVRRDLWLLGIALLIWAAVCFGLWERERVWAQMGLLPDAESVVAVRSLSHLAIAIAAALGLYSVRQLFKAIGSRSREYRRAQGGRQGIRPMMVSTLGVSAGSACRYLSTFEHVPEKLDELGVIIVGVSMLMLVIGLVYLLVNAWWIRRVLRKPPPRLRDLLQPMPEWRRSLSEDESASSDRS